MHMESWDIVSPLGLISFNQIILIIHLSIIERKLKATKFDHKAQTWKHNCKFNAK